MNAEALQIEVDSAEVRHLTVIGGVPGVAPRLAAARNGAGTGALIYDDDGLRWRAPGSETFGEPVDCSAGGQFVIYDGEDADKWIRVEVHAEYLVAGSQTDVYLAEVFNNAVGGSDVDDADAAAGCVDEYALSLRNVDELPVKNLKIWLDADARLAISLDGEAWSAPADEAGGLAVAAVEPDETVTVHVRRAIAAAAPAAPTNRVGLHFAFDAYPTIVES